MISQAGLAMDETEACHLGREVCDGNIGEGVSLVDSGHSSRSRRDPLALGNPALMARQPYRCCRIQREEETYG